MKKEAITTMVEPDLHRDWKAFLARNRAKGSVVVRNAIKAIMSLEPGPQLDAFTKEEKRVKK